MKLLLTGFEPFGGFKTNPSWDALQHAADQGLFEAEVSLQRIPVRYDGAFAALEAALHAARPDAAISFGLHGGLNGREPTTLYLETTARNRDGATKPDNDGVSREAAPIVVGGPDVIAASLPAGAMLAALGEAGFHAELSDDAGAYLCNHLFYLGARRLKIPYGFVHVPPVDSMGGVLSLAQLARAAATLANTLARHIAKP